MSDFEQHNGVVYRPEPTAYQGETPAQLEERIDRMRFEAAKAQREHNERVRQEQDARNLEISLKGSGYYQTLVQGGSLQHRALTAGEKAAHAEAAANPGTVAAPRALVDSLNIKIGGTELGPQQSRQMMERGEISRADYVAAVNKALGDADAARVRAGFAPYGYSFR